MTPAKQYVTKLLASLKPGDEIHMSSVTIDKGLFMEYIYRCIDARAMWDYNGMKGDLTISEDGSKIKYIA